VRSYNNRALREFTLTQVVKLAPVKSSWHQDAPQPLVIPC
jgi:hypothetical protein